MEHLIKKSPQIYLEIPYGIGKFIQKEVTKNAYDEGKACLDYSCFKSGPNPLFCQMKQGLILVKRNEVPVEILTPWGSWNILNGCHCHGNWKKVHKAIEEPLGLVLFGKEIVTARGNRGPFYVITEYEGKEIEWPVYRESSQYLSPKKVRAIWKKFTAEHLF